MNDQVKEIGPFERTLTVVLDDGELDAAKTKAARKLSRSLKIKGFRPGKAPRKIVESMVGAETLRQEAIDEALPAAVTKSLVSNDLTPVTPPQVEDIRTTADGGVEVDFRITLWPRIERAPDLTGRKVEVLDVEVTERDVEEQIDRLRNQFAELEDVSRPADNGDYVMINLTATRNGVEVKDASANDLLYEVGSGSFLPGLDETLLSASAGEIRETPSTLPPGFGDDAGSQVDLRVLVKGVRAKKLPEVTDEWVSDVTEFDTAVELVDELRARLGRLKRAGALERFREKIVEEVVAEVDLELPSALITAEMEARLHNMSHDLESRGITIAQYLQAIGQDEESFVAGLQTQSERALKTRIALEAVAAAHEIEVAESDLTNVFAAIAEGTGESVDAVRKRFGDDGQGQSVAGDILRRKALDWLVAEATPVDANGNPVDLTIEDEVLDTDGGDRDPETSEHPADDEDEGGQDPAENED